MDMPAPPCPVDYHLEGAELMTCKLSDLEYGSSVVLQVPLACLMGVALEQCTGVTETCLRLRLRLRFGTSGVTERCLRLREGLRVLPLSLQTKEHSNIFVAGWIKSLGKTVLLLELACSYKLTGAKEIDVQSLDELAFEAQGAQGSTTFCGGGARERRCEDNQRKRDADRGEPQGCCVSKQFGGHAADPRGHGPAHRKGTVPLPELFGDGWTDRPEERRGWPDGGKGFAGDPRLRPVLRREVFAARRHGLPRSPRAVCTRGGDGKDQADAEIPAYRR